MIKRKIIALFLSLAAMLSLTSTVYADDVTESSRETVRIGNFDCWIENGEYYTELDGEIGLVIDIGNAPTQSVDSAVTYADKEIWQMANPEVDLTDDKVYQGAIFLNQRDDYTPIFKINTGEVGFASFQFRTKFIFPNSYKVTTHTYNTDLGEWYHHDRTVIFSAAVQYVLFVDGTATPNVSKCCVYFHKEGSTGEEVFDFWAKQVKYG